jgi:CRP-like cAMP-binding protein
LSRTGNLLLDSLPLPLRDTIIAASRPLSLEHKKVLVRRGQGVVGHVFLTDGMASLVVTMKGGETLEVGMIGREGLTGASSLIGSDKSHSECVIQIPGKGLRVPSSFLQSLFSSSAEFRGKILDGVQRQLNIASQLTACGVIHQAEGRFARWLLTASDLTGSPTLKLTQEYLGQMLGTRRTTVSVAAHPLMERGLISMVRGTVKILDRPGLIQLACECYEICSKITPGALGIGALESKDFSEEHQPSDGQHPTL